MNDMLEKLNQNADRENEIKLALGELYGLNKEEATPDFKAVGILAIECACKLFTVILNVRKPNEGLNYKATMDLTIGLNDNPFWLKHASRLLPLLQMALHAQADYAILMYEKKENPTSTQYDKLRGESELVGLEIFVMVNFLLNGSDIAISKSLEIKKRILPFLGE